jgi:hypothetical protein
MEDSVETVRFDRSRHEAQDATDAEINEVYHHGDEAQRFRSSTLQARHLKTAGRAQICFCLFNWWVEQHMQVSGGLRIPLISRHCVSIAHQSAEENP